MKCKLHHASFDILGPRLISPWEYVRFILPAPRQYGGGAYVGPARILRPSQQDFSFASAPVHDLDKSVQNVRCIVWEGAGKGEAFLLMGSSVLLKIFRGVDAKGLKGS